MMGLSFTRNDNIKIQNFCSKCGKLYIDLPGADCPRCGKKEQKKEVK